MENKSRFSFLMDDNNGNNQNSMHDISYEQGNNRWDLLTDNQKAKPDGLEDNNSIVNGVAFKEGEAKYRSEQLTVIKLNGIIENHSDTKLEYHVKKYIDNGHFIAEVKLADQVIIIHPSYLQESLDLMSGIDLVKCNVIVEINKVTGKIDRIANMDDIWQRWINLKKTITKNAISIQSPEVKNNLENYLNETEKQFTAENILLDFKIRPFFDIFFGPLLVDANISFQPYKKLYYSQLFNRLPVDFDVSLQVVDETASTISILKEARLNENSPHLNDFEQIYNQLYKPKIGYKFSEYNYWHDTTINFNKNLNLLDEATMNITEEVKNNIDLFVDYKIRRIA